MTQRWLIILHKSCINKECKISPSYFSKQNTWTQSFTSCPCDSLETSGVLLRKRCFVRIITRFHTQMQGSCKVPTGHCYFCTNTRGCQAWKLVSKWITKRLQKSWFGCVCLVENCAGKVKHAPNLVSTPLIANPSKLHAATHDKSNRNKSWWQCHVNKPKKKKSIEFHLILSLYGKTASRSFRECNLDYGIKWVTLDGYHWWPFNCLFAIFASFGIHYFVMRISSTLKFYLKWQLSVTFFHT